MAEETVRIPTFRPGDRIALGIEARDESGVRDVEAVFTNAQESGKQIALRGDGGGESWVEVALEGYVASGMAPGLYECFYVSLTDTLGNKRVTRPTEIRFRIEGISGDYEGPRLESWRWFL